MLKRKKTNGATPGSFKVSDLRKRKLYSLNPQESDLVRVGRQGRKTLQREDVKKTEKGRKKEGGPARRKTVKKNHATNGRGREPEKDRRLLHMGSPRNHTEEKKKYRESRCPRVPLERDGNRRV